MSEKEYIGILVAMDEELSGILKLVKNMQEREIKDIVFYLGTICGNRVVIAKTGVGKVNSSRTAMVMNYEFKLQSVLNIGVAGAINPTLFVGNIIIGKTNVQYDFDITAFGHKKGYIPGVGDIIPSTEKLVAICEEKLVDTFKNIKVGVVSTGDRFCTSLKDRFEIYRVFDADAVDMEGASVAQICYLNKIPFVSVKVISDCPSGNNEIEYENNLEFACNLCAEVTAKILEGEF